MTAPDPRLAAVHAARVRQNQTIGVFVDLWLMASEAQRGRLGYSIVDRSIRGPAGTVVGEYRYSNGVCVVDWLRSYADLVAIDEAVDQLLKEDS